ncbi:MAG: cytochrome P450 [Pseudomonadota bacterium]
MRRSYLEVFNEHSYRMKMGVIKFPGKKVFVANQPELVKQIMLDDVASFPKHKIVGDVLEPLLGESIFSTNGAKWRKQRDMLDVAFDNAQVERVYGRMQEAVNVMLARLDAYPKDAPVDVDPEMTMVTANIIFSTIMSSDLDESQARTVIDAFVRFQEASPTFALLNMLDWLGDWIPRLFDSKRRKDAKIIRSSLEQVIRPRYEAFRRGEADEHDDILSSILRAQDPDTGQGFAFDEIVDQIAMLFLAGHETSASALTWTLYLLAISPEVQQAAFDEIVQITGDALPGQALAPIPLAAVKRMGLVRKIFMESMRLYPPVGFFTRQTTHAMSMRDKELPQGASVIVAPWLLHRHRELWDAPDEFCPMRFDAKTEGRGVPKNAYLPFGMGQRVCIGASFAMQEGILILAEILRRYQLELAPGFQPEPVGRLTIRSENGMRLSLRPRNAQASEVV